MNEWPENYDVLSFDTDAYDQLAERVRTGAKALSVILGLGGLMTTVGLAHAGVGFDPAAISSLLDWSVLYADGFHGGHDAAGAMMGVSY
ncbi:MAG: hypothetical protein R3194_14315 [Limnobacter sp.]|nr:hypothetical protein [Limnobacter sp.]